eukprot:TRINITY_DN3578_c0_g1_i1.p1 TRINITY_DN3578_c0_g1~~TRINITY_DN3578_c0_g1_i1.p1  ORF type:complete len:960 (+),score=199.61 TRINITY_DN3578_c0_g1_i1:223-2880(+)
MVDVNLNEENTESEPERQKKIIEDLIHNQGYLTEGKMYYLLSSQWWGTWKKWAGYISAQDRNYYYQQQGIEYPKPGPINNDVLLDTDEGPDIVMKGKSEHSDYVILDKTVWDQFFSWYGGGPVIERKCIKQRAAYQSSVIVETRKLKIKVVWSKKPKTVPERWFSRADTISFFIDTMQKEFKFDKTKVKVYDFHSARKVKHLTELSKTMEESQIYDMQHMLIEQPKKDGKWPSDKIYKHLAQQSSYNYHRTPTLAGCTGLQNLGNTCFMNSGIQCLSATAPLIDYFLNGKFLTEINKDNPLGMKGEFAEAYADLLKELWSNRTSVATPREVKNVISKYAPQFTGYAQHDSHELLAFLLDGLHEDLNRIKKKPYVETKDSDGRPDEEVAMEAWETYKKRNDSIIVDFFQGQLKSRLKCPTNGRISNQFDPFMYLSVPIPVKNTRKIILTYYPIDTSLPPKKYGLSIEKTATVWNLKEKLSGIVGVPPQSLLTWDVFSNKFHAEFQNFDEVSRIRDSDDVAAYEIKSKYDDIPIHIRKNKKKPENETEEDYVRLSIFSRETDNSYSTRYGFSCIGVPFTITVTNPITYDQLYDTLLDYLVKRKYLQFPEEEVVNKKELFEIHTYQNYSSFPLDKDSQDPIKISDKDTIILAFSPDNKTNYYRGQKEKWAQADKSAESVVESGGKDVVTLEECLSSFTSEEQLGENDAWYCSECKEHKQAFKKFDIWTAPKLLVVQLKRFSQVNRVWRDRLDNLVQFPLDNWDLTSHVLGPKEAPPIYDLYAVSNHYGSMGGGHYTAYTRHRTNNKWYKCDDSSVSEASPGEVVSRAAYVLFYRRRDVEWAPFDDSLDKFQASAEEEEESSSEEEEMDTTEPPAGTPHSDPANANNMN